MEQLDVWDNHAPRPVVAPIDHVIGPSVDQQSSHNIAGVVPATALPDLTSWCRSEGQLPSMVLLLGLRKATGHRSAVIRFVYTDHVWRCGAFVPGYSSTGQPWKPRCISAMVLWLDYLLALALRTARLTVAILAPLTCLVAVFLGAIGLQTALIVYGVAAGVIVLGSLGASCCMRIECLSMPFTGINVLHSATGASAVTVTKPWAAEAPDWLFSDGLCTRNSRDLQRSSSYGVRFLFHPSHAGAEIGASTRVFLVAQSMSPNARRQQPARYLWEEDDHAFITGNAELEDLLDLRRIGTGYGDQCPDEFVDIHALEVIDEFDESASLQN